MEKINPNQNAILNLPPAVKFICIANLASFIALYLLPYVATDGFVMNIMYKLSFTPSELSFSTSYSLITHLFVHAGFLHLAVNLGMLMAMGTAIEKTLGVKSFLLLYFVTGILAALSQALVSTSGESIVGASGAISGLLGGVIIIMHDNRISAENYKSFFVTVMACIAATVLFGIFGMPGVNESIAWVAHLGGFASGLLLYKPISKLTF